MAKGKCKSPMREKFDGLPIETSENWFCDSYSGSAQDLLAANLVTNEELLRLAANGRGKVRFHPDGTIFPTGAARGWRIPLHKAVFAVDERTVRVEITVSKELQRTRLRNQRIADCKSHEERICAEAAKHRHSQLEHEYDPAFESWTGTKAQLQAAGIGCGLKFPGEAGAAACVESYCPLGFNVRIQTHYDESKARAGIFRATSDYIEGFQSLERDREVPYVNGVTQILNVWTTNREIFVGSARSLVACGLASIEQFPGQPGRGKTQCTYRSDGTDARNSKAQWALTIKRTSKDRYCIEVPTSDVVKAAREKARDEHQQQVNEELRQARDDRMMARVSARLVKSGPADVDEFREDKGQEVETWLDLIWKNVFRTSAGIFKFQIAKDDQAYEDLADAFQMIRDAVSDASVIRDRKAEEQLCRHQKVAAARADSHLQAFLGSATKAALAEVAKK